MATRKARTVQQQVSTADADIRVDFIYRGESGLVARCHVQVDSGDHEVVEVELATSALTPAQRSAADLLVRELHAEAVAALGFR